MGSYTNFKNYGDIPPPDGSGWKPEGNYPLARQSSVFSLTFDEFQNSLGGSGKEFGSMNMEEFLKSIWTAEETQAMSSHTSGGNGIAQVGNLQRQGSLTLPRTLSQKTVDEVWKEVLRETIDDKGGRNSVGVSSFGQSQPTLGEMTLEEFLLRAGVVREGIVPSGMPNAGVTYGALSSTSGRDTGFSTGFQQQPKNQGTLANELPQNSNLALNSSDMGMNMGGYESSQHYPQQLQQQPGLQPLFPKQTTGTFSSHVQVGNNAQLTDSGAKTPVVGISNPRSKNMFHGGANVAGVMHGGVIAISGGSPGSHLNSDVFAKSDVDTSSLSPSPYAFGEGGRGRRSAASLEKVVERRRKRMIKNRESAARSRARKQAYTLELESEVSKLKEMNRELRKKQVEIMEMQKNQMLEMMRMPRGGKRRCLRRTLTGPW